jgi:hypothetical protein
MKFGESLGNVLQKFNDLISLSYYKYVPSSAITDNSHSVDILSVNT